MQGWSWMAALTLVASTVGGFAPASSASEPPPVKQKVILNFSIDGLSASGGEIEIKPGHAGCKFDTIKFNTKTNPLGIDGKYHLDPIDIETEGADNDCSFAITLKEAGQPDKTIRRSLRIVPPVEGKPSKPQTLNCYLSSNSLKPAVIATKPEESKKTDTSKPADEPKRKK